MSEPLGTPDTAALLALMGAGREVSTPELEAMVGFTIRKEVRERLNELGMVESSKKGRSYFHKITPKGLGRCAEELSAEVPPKPGPLGRALYVILAGLEHYLQRQHIQLKDVFQPDAENSQIARDGLESQIRAAYQKLAKEPRDWVPLADLRAELKNDIDALLKKMSRDRQVQLEPDSNRKTLTDADHAAAIRIGGEDNHLIAIEES